MEGPAPKPEKPPVLYHASSRADLDQLEPRAEKVRDSKEGPRIFATPDKAMATIFLVGTDDSWTHSGAFDGKPYIVISDEKRYREMDKGGVIYSLPNDSFETDAGKGLGELEWTSPSTVTPLTKEVVPSALDAMVANNVQVYFVDRETFEQINAASDHGLSILRSLTSENRKRDPASTGL